MRKPRGLFAPVFLPVSPDLVAVLWSEAPPGTEPRRSLRRGGRAVGCLGFSGRRDGRRRAVAVMIGRRGNNVGANAWRHGREHGWIGRVGRGRGTWWPWSRDAALSGHRRDRLHRRPARAGAAGGGAPGALPGPVAGRSSATIPWAGDVEVGSRATSPTRSRSLRPCAASTSRTTWCTRSAPGPGFEETDRRAARVFAEQAQAAGVRRIVYLGGLTPAGVPERGAVAASAVAGRGRAHPARLRRCPTTVLRAAVIIGSGSASFEMLRYLTERLPVMVTPSWVRTRIQPIAVRDVLRYLVGRRAHAGRRQPGLRHRRARRPDVPRDDAPLRRGRRSAAPADRAGAGADPGPVQPLGRPGHPRARLDRPAAHRVAAPRGRLPRARHRPVTCPTRRAGRSPSTRRCALALRRVREAQVATRWSSASLPGAPSDPLPTDPDWAGGSLYTDERELTVDASPEALWRVIEGIGGDNGWYSFPLAWAVRGWLDRLVGGVGLRRGRRDAATAAGRRLAGLLAGRGDRARTAAAAARRDAAAGPRLAGDVRRRRRERSVPATGSVPCSIRAGCSGTPTGGACRPSTRVVFGGMARNIAKAAAQDGSGRGTASPVGRVRRAR